MKYHKQLFRHRPEEDLIGDCHRTALACLLDYEPAAVPHFAQEHWLDPDGIGFDRTVRRWLESQGYKLVSVAYTVESLEQLMGIMSLSAPEVFYLLGGTSRNGTNHTVIGCGGAIAHDPSLDDSGIVGPLLDMGVYLVQFLIPLNLCSKSSSCVERAA